MDHQIEDLLEHWLPLADDAWVLAVITQIQGSAYRKPGAMMLFHEFGQGVGMLSGGCLKPISAAMPKRPCRQSKSRA